MIAGLKSDQFHSAERDKHLQTETVTPEILAYIVNKIIRAIEPRQIILFGSRARGDEKDTSDVDLFIIHDGRSSDREVRRQIERLLWGRRFGVDLIVRTPVEVARNVHDGNPFYTRHIFTEGRVLYERPADTSS
jgi:predicted nucleotidyltransferase